MIEIRSCDSRWSYVAGLLLAMVLSGCDATSDHEVLLEEPGFAGAREEFQYMLTHRRNKWFYEGDYANVIPYIPQPHEDIDWIYLNTQKGAACAPDIALTHHEDDWSTTPLKGCVYLDNDSVIIGLYIPQKHGGHDHSPAEDESHDHSHTDGEGEHDVNSEKSQADRTSTWRPYAHNGFYTLKRW